MLSDCRLKSVQHVLLSMLVLPYPVVPLQKMWLVSEKVLSSSIIATSSIAITYCILILLIRLLTSSTISLLAISEIYNITPLVLLTLPIFNTFRNKFFTFNYFSDKSSIISKHFCKCLLRSVNRLFIFQVYRYFAYPIHEHQVKNLLKNRLQTQHNHQN